MTEKDKMSKKIKFKLYWYSEIRDIVKMYPGDLQIVERILRFCKEEERRINMRFGEWKKANLILEVN